MANDNIFLDEPFLSAWQDKNPFAEVATIEGEVFRAKEGRRTLRFEFNSDTFFLKHFKGVGWKEIFKNLVQFRLPVINAGNEYRAAKILANAGVDTLTPVAFGCRGKNPAAQESFLVTLDLVNTSSLEDYCRDWSTVTPQYAVKRALIRKVAYIARTMHNEGINHRDFYLCHFLLETGAEAAILRGENFHCHLIDLHRCQLREQVPERWREKDLAGLYYSAMDIGLSRRDILYFIKHYCNDSLESSMKKCNWQEISNKALALYSKDFHRAPKKIPWDEVAT
jgi:heptose I phosphotransferase